MYPVVPRKNTVNDELKLPFRVTKAVLANGQKRLIV